MQNGALLIRDKLWPGEASRLAIAHNELFHIEDGKAHIETDPDIPLFGADGHTRLPMYTIKCEKCTSVVAATGHRPNKLQVEHPYDAHWENRLQDLAEAALSRIEPSWVITGMAQGWDQAIGRAAVSLDIPFVAALPFSGQESQWSDDAKQRYFTLLMRANATVIVNGAFHPTAYHDRNHWMVDRATEVLALWDGNTRGGTAHTARYAQSKRVRIRNMWSSWTRYR